MQANTDPALKAALQSFTASAAGNLLNVSMSVSQDQLQQVLKPRTAVKRQLKKM
jgi:Na+(H+)/acetate symporter ActP